MTVGVFKKWYASKVVHAHLISIGTILWRTNDVLNGLRSETIFDNWKPCKNDEKCFVFHPKSSFHSQDI